MSNIIAFPLTNRKAHNPEKDSVYTRWTSIKRMFDSLDIEDQAVVMDAFLPAKEDVEKEVKRIRFIRYGE
jgi:hypothetical protein